MSSGLLRASAVMASGTMISRVLGLVKAMLLVFAIGQTQSISGDAFANGNLLPNTLYMVLLGGMLNAVLVPQIVKAAMGPDGGAGYINKVLTLIAGALFAVTVLAMVAAPWLVHLFALDWEPDQRALATGFAYWCLPQIVFYGLYTVLGEVLNAKRVFGPYTWAPVLNNVIGIAGIVVFIAMFGSDPNGNRTTGDWTAGSIALLAGSATLGVVAQALILFVSWRKAGLRYRPDFAWRGMGLGQTGRIAGWSIATITVMQLGGLITNNVVNTASGVGPSALAMQNAWLIFMMPHSVLAVSIGTAYFTRLAEWGQAGRMREFRADFSASVRTISLVMVLASVVILVCAPYLSRLMQLGSTMDQVDQFAVVLRVYMVGLAAYSFLFVVQRAFYALSDTRTPFLFTTFQIVLVVIFSIGCLWLPREIVGAGLALVFSLATIAEVFLAVRLLRRKIGEIDGRAIAASLGRSLIAALPTAAFGFGLVLLGRTLFPEFGALVAILSSLVVGAACSLIYGVTLSLLRSPELADLGGWVAAKIGRKRA